jgi:hypothetical protein
MYTINLCSGIGGGVGIPVAREYLLVRVQVQFSNTSSINQDPQYTGRKNFEFA